MSVVCGIFSNSMMKRFLYMLIPLFLLAGACGTGGSRQKTGKDGHRTELKSFPYPEIPSMVTDPEERRTYLLEHFWNGFDFRDTVLLKRREITERGFADFITLLLQEPDSTQWYGSMKDLTMKLAGPAYGVFGELAERYLYDPNSPVYNEELYLAFLDSFLKLKMEDEAVRERLLFHQEMGLKNRVGHPANDFEYTTADGKQGRMRNCAPGKPLVLIFHDPDCLQCCETMAFLQGNEVLQEKVKAGKVAVLAVYSEGIDEIWQAHRKDLPKAWISVTDGATVKRSLLYDLKAMPTLYLLDGERRVLLKDAYPGQLIDYLQRNM